MSDQPLKTAYMARRYLIDDNGWTDQEVDGLFDTIAPYPRTADDWAEVASRYARLHLTDDPQKGSS